jgi:hypothetical protein
MKGLKTTIIIILVLAFGTARNVNAKGLAVHAWFHGLMLGAAFNF